MTAYFCGLIAVWWFLVVCLLVCGVGWLFDLVAWLLGGCVYVGFGLGLRLVLGLYCSGRVCCLLLLRFAFGV